jgi:hypothetical protein
VIRAIGDDRQLPAIGPAGWYAEQLAEHPGTELTHVYRQRNPDDVRDFTDLGAGKVEQAVRSLDERQRIYVVEEYGQRAHVIVDLYLQERMRGRSAHDVRVIVDGSNHVLDDLNRRIQHERLVMDEIGPRPLHVRATDNDRAWSLYRERVITPDSTVVRNGERGRIVTVDHHRRRITVVLENGRRVDVDLREEAHTQPVVPAYAVHTNTFQGGEVPVPIYSPSRHATRQSAYTAATRATEDLHIVIDKESYGDQPVDGLVRDWSRVSDKRTAWSQLGEAGRERWAQWKGGTDDDADGGRHGAAAPSRDDGDPPNDTQPTEPAAPSAAREERRNGSEDIGERARRGAQTVHRWRRDLDEVRAAVRDLRDAEVERAVEADDHEAAASLISDEDLEPEHRFGDLDAIMERRRDRIARARERAGQGECADAEPEPQPEQGHVEHEETWIDLDALRQQRMEAPRPQFPPPDREHGR